MSPRPRRHLVRPRWVWGGLGVAVVGAVSLAAGMIRLDHTLDWVGVGLLVAGGAAAAYGGILGDAHGALSLGEELREVAHGDVHRGTVAGGTYAGSQVSAEAHAATEAARAEVVRRQQAPRPPLAMAGGVLLLVAAGFVLCAQGLYPHTPTGQDNAVRDLGLAVVVGLAGLRFVFSPGGHSVAGGLAVLAGVVLVVLSLLSGHGATRTAVLEGITGGWVVAAALLSLFSPSSSVRLGFHPRRHSPRRSAPFREAA